MSCFREDQGISVRIRVAGGRPVSRILDDVLCTDEDDPKLKRGKDTDSIEINISVSTDAIAEIGCCVMAMDRMDCDEAVDDDGGVSMVQQFAHMVARCVVAIQNADQPTVQSPKRYWTAGDRSTAPDQPEPV